MIRIELIERRSAGLFTIGLYQLISENFFELTNLDGKPRLQNPYSIYFPTYEGKKKRIVSHLGLFPAMEYTGLVFPLTSSLELGNKGVMSFAPGSISFDMLVDNSATTVTKGA
jgi:hypothetical protein